MGAPRPPASASHSRVPQPRLSPLTIDVGPWGTSQLCLGYVCGSPTKLGSWGAHTGSDSSLGPSSTPLPCLCSNCPRRISAFPKRWPWAVLLGLLVPNSTHAHSVQGLADPTGPKLRSQVEPRPSLPRLFFCGQPLSECSVQDQSQFPPEPLPHPWRQALLRGETACVSHLPVCITSSCSVVSQCLSPQALALGSPRSVGALPGVRQELCASPRAFFRGLGLQG